MYFLMGTVFTATKLGLAHAEPLFFLAVRMILAGVLLVGYVLLFEREHNIWTARRLFLLILLASFNIYLTNGFEFWAMQYVSSAKASFLYNLSPFVSAVLCILFFKEKMAFKKWLGLIIGFLGFIPIFLEDSRAEEGLSGWFFISTAEMAMVFAVFATIIGFMIFQRVVTEEGLPPITANAYSTLIGGLFALGHSLLFEDWSPSPVFGRVDTFLWAVLWTMVASSFLFYNIAGFVLKRFSVTFTAFCSFMSPFLTAGFSWVLLGEEVGATFFISGLVVFVGLYLFYVEELKAGIRIKGADESGGKV